HELVLVHPFNNGNGRWSRLAADAVLQRLANQPPLTWATDTLVVDSAEREAYIAALKKADNGDIAPLVDYLRALNPKHLF
ncbi:MAG: mobile mystery protein B, partial [Pseudomonadales bacterium]